MTLFYVIVILLAFCVSYAGWENTMRLVAYLDIQVRYFFVKIRMWFLKRKLEKQMKRDFDDLLSRKKD